MDRRIFKIGNQSARVIAGAALMLVAFTGRAEDDWSFEVTPYLWVAFADVETSVPSEPPAASDDASTFEKRISGAAMLAAQAKYKSVGLNFDFAWVRVDSEAVSPGPEFSSGDLRSDIIHSTLMLSYSLPLHGKLHADVLAGARLWHSSEELSYTSGTFPGFNASSDKTWVDPMMGGTLRYDLSERWCLNVRGLAGGFGAGSNLEWEIYGGVEYSFSDWCSMVLGYRYLYQDYDRDDFQLKLEVHGLLVGVVFRF